MMALAALEILAAAAAVAVASSSASAVAAASSAAPTASDDGGGPPLRVVVATSGLTIVFNASAAPISLKNAQGDELLGAGSVGFSLRATSPAKSAAGHPVATTVRFDTIAPGAGPMAYVFGVSGSSEQLSVTFGGANHYLTANITSTRGFQCNEAIRRYLGQCTTVSFDLTGRQPDTLRGMGLNFMINDHSGEGHASESEPMLKYEAPWENSTWNPRPRFAIYERVDDDTEDDTLYDLWVDEGVAHPRVNNGTWDRARARAWIQGWTAATYDMSHIAMVPRNLSEWRAFFPYAKLMDAKSLWFNFREWAGSSIDNVDPKMFPSGVAGFKAFSDDAAKNGNRITTHRMSGGLMPTDPDYCVKPDPGLLGWGDMTLVSAVKATDSQIVVKPAPGVKIPVLLKDWRANMSTEVYEQVDAGLGACSIADEMLSYQSIAPLPDGNWVMAVTRARGDGAAHPAGALVRGYVKGNEYFIPDLFSDLYEEVAVRYANFSNLVGFDDGSFDGAAWFAWYGRWGFYKFASLVYQNLDHPTAVHTSGVVVSTSWIEYYPRFKIIKNNVSVTH
jgi:hypothetical protein